MTISRDSSGVGPKQTILQMILTASTISKVEEASSSINTMAANLILIYNPRVNVHACIDTTRDNTNESVINGKENTFLRDSRKNK